MNVGRALDKAIGLLAPLWAARRLHARATLDQISEYTSGSTTGGYDAGRYTRWTKHRTGSTANENEIPRQQLAQLRQSSWDLFRNNGHARKICRSLRAKVVWRVIRPESQASLPDGSPHLEFRERAEALWKALSTRLDYRGRPGEGGQTISDLGGVALLNVILAGGVLYRFRYDDADPQDVRLSSYMVPPVRVQLIHNARLNGSIEKYGANAVHGGIEVDKDGRRVAYHILGDPLIHGRRGAAIGDESQRVLADQIRHLYIGDDVDQLRGVPWFASALLKLRDVGDYEFNELQAAAMAACIVLGYRRSSGQSNFGVTPNTDWDLTDADGNPITDIRPGMLLDLGANGQLDGFNPQRPNTNAVEFITHELRSAAAGLPGIKSSTITGDYRRASFASERAADNDTWPEIEILQDWFAAGFSQPIYEQVVVEGVAFGWFDQVKDFSAGDFVARRDNYLEATWNGPVPRSINPRDDADAATLRVAGGTSSPQIEASLLGRSSEDILRDIAEFLDLAKQLKLPKQLIDNMLGIEPTAVVAAQVKDDTNEEPDSHAGRAEATSNEG